MFPSRSAAPFRAEHIGSFRRPERLLKKREDFTKGLCNAEELREVEDEAIKELVLLQKSLGIKTITDGEFRREGFMDGVFNQVEGSQKSTDSPEHIFLSYVPFNKGGESRDTTYLCTGKLRRTKPLYENEFNGLKQFLSPEEVKYIKIDICAPEWFHFKHGHYVYEKSDGAYLTDEEYFADIAKIYQEEIQYLYNIGLRNLQIDDPLLTFFCDQNITAGMKEYGFDPDKLFRSYINLLKDCLKGRPADMNIGLHLCRGNVKEGFASGAYDHIAATLFNEIPADSFYLEYDTERAGGFEPLKHLPKDKFVVLGIVSTKLVELEDREYLKRKIFEAADIIALSHPERTREAALNQICISPQCGFSTKRVPNHPLTDEDIKRKLNLLVETAKEIWGSL